MQRGFKDTTEGAKAAKSGAAKSAVKAREKQKEGQERGTLERDVQKNKTLQKVGREK